MAIGPIEMATVTRIQDFTQLKQNEDNKGMLTQMSVADQQGKENEQKARQVNTSEESRWNNSGKFDAREKGSNEYASDGGKNRKKNAEKKEAREKMVVKRVLNPGFDRKV